MSDDKHHDLLALLNSLDPNSFEALVADLLREAFPNAEIQRNVRFGSFQADFIVRVPVTKDSALSSVVVVEVKRVRLAAVDLVEYQVGRFRLLRSDTPNLEYILFVSGHLTKAARVAAQRYGLRVWDGTHIVSHLSADLLAKWFGIAGSQPPPDPQIAISKTQSLITVLGSINPGEADAPKYQKWVADVFEHLFVPPLGPVHYEDSDAERRNRRDLILENWAPDGFWSQIRTVYAADQVVVDAKNYSGFMKKRPVLDLSHYLKPYGCGMFGILCSRKGAGPSAIHAMREHWIGARKMILALSDSVVIEMLQLKDSGTPPEEILRREIANFRKSM